MLSFILPLQGRSSNQKTLNTFFVNDIYDAPGADGLSAITFGRANVNGNGLAIDAVSVLQRDRKDTFAHEVGHNLGLNHTTFGAGLPDNLITAGTTRNIPTMALVQQQIDKIRASQFVVEAPKLTLTHHVGTQAEGYRNSLSVNFDLLPEGVSLHRMSIDLPDPVLPSLTALGAGGRPHEYTATLSFDSASRPDAGHGVGIPGGEEGANRLLRGIECGSSASGVIQTCYGENMPLHRCLHYARIRLRPFHGWNPGGG